MVSNSFDPSDESAVLQLCLERDRLLSDAEFARSPSMSKLLRFLVDYKLSGNSTPLKAYIIAVDALGRDQSFDTQTDSYPRVQMGRLRRMLDNFYLREGGENRLSIARNNYEIVLEPNELRPAGAEDLIGHSAAEATADAPPLKPAGPDPPEPPLLARVKPAFSQGQFGNILGVSILLALAGIWAYLLWPENEPDEIAYPKIYLSMPKAHSDPAVNDRTEAIENRFVRNLKGFEFVRVFDLNSEQPDDPGYIIRLAFLDPSADRIELRLLDRPTGEILWSREIEAANPEALQLELDKAAIALVGHYGIIAQRELSLRQNDYAAGYPCLLQFDQYIRYREPEQLDPVLECLRESVKRFPNDAYVLSMLAFAQNLAKRPGVPDRFEGYSMELARRAEAIDHDSAVASFAVAQAAFFEGDCRTGVSWGKKAVELNPLGSRISGYLGLYMLGCKYPEGERYVARALELDPDADLVIAATLAFQMLKRGDVQKAHELTAAYMAASPRNEPGLELTYVLSSAMLGDMDEARRVWKILAGRFDMPENSPPRAVLGKWIANPLLINEIMVVIDEVGLAVP